MSGIVLVVPYRDRLAHLTAFVPYMERFLGAAEARILVVQQEPGQPFNRGALLNIGFSLARSSATRFVFHDVDMLPLDDSCNYRRLESVFHLAGSAEQFHYRLPYENYVGGVLAMDSATFEKVNGYSNEYWGWGAEDDDLYLRLWLHDVPIVRVAGRFRSLAHAKAPQSGWNAARLSDLLSRWVVGKEVSRRVTPAMFRRMTGESFTSVPGGVQRCCAEGLSTLQFRVTRRLALKHFADFNSEIMPWHELVSVAI